MSIVHERIYIEAPYTLAVGVLERRLGLEPGRDRGSCELTLIVAAATVGREFARVVVAATERLAGAANYSSRYSIGWAGGKATHGVPTPAFAGTLALGAGEDYEECELQLEGRYDPPGGAAGQVFDDMLGKRIAHATLSALLDGVGRDLQREHERIESTKRKE